MTTAPHRRSTTDRHSAYMFCGQDRQYEWTGCSGEPRSLPDHHPDRGDNRRFVVTTPGTRAVIMTVPGVHHWIDVAVGVVRAEDGIVGWRERFRVGTAGHSHVTASQPPAAIGRNHLRTTNRRTGSASGWRAPHARQTTVISVGASTTCIRSLPHHAHCPSLFARNEALYVAGSQRHVHSASITVAHPRLRAVSLHRSASPPIAHYNSDTRRA